MISFISKDTGDTLILGGVSSFSGSDKGVVGPFPRYSISREDLSLTDGSYLSSKFSITVTGTATLKSSSSQDMLTKGQRQAAIQGEAIILSQLNRNQWPMHGNGVLEIAPYGGLGNKIKFNDARIKSLDLPEQDENAGVQNLEYTIQFEAYQDGSDDSETATATYNLSSAEESWDISPAEDRYSYDGNAPATRYKAYTLTHTVSAVGIKVPETGGKAKDAWKQAADFVLARATNTIQKMEKNILGLEGNEFDPLEDLGFSLTSATASDYTRTVNSDMTGGKYSVTDTWVISEGTENATIDMEVSYEQSNTESVNTVTVSGTVTGLETDLSTSGGSSSKYSNALAAYNSIKGNFYSAASAVYTGPNALKNDEYAKNVSDNKTQGTITFSVSYKDHMPLFSGAIEDSVQVDDNGGTDVIAIIGVLLKPDGPVIQDMGTITEKRKSVTYTAKMKIVNRGSQPTHGIAIVNGYQPPNSYISASSQSWSSGTGDYSVTKEFVYTSAGPTFA
jgi:hypothetical protein